MADGLFGLDVVTSPYAREVRDEFHVERWPIKKRRRNWRVVKVHIDRPCAFVINQSALGLMLHPSMADDQDKVVMLHPELMAKLKGAI